VDLVHGTIDPVHYLFSFENNFENCTNFLCTEILQKDPSSLFYLCCPCNFTKTPSNFSKIIFSSL
jgi:hypothetical protein